MLNDSVSTPSSSRETTGWRRVKSPCATARVPSASRPSGARSAPTARPRGPAREVSASSSVSVSVSAYRRFNAVARERRSPGSRAAGLHASRCPARAPCGTGSMTCSTLQRIEAVVGVHRHDDAQQQAAVAALLDLGRTSAAGARGAAPARGGGSGVARRPADAARPPGRCPSARTARPRTRSPARPRASARSTSGACDFGERHRHLARLVRPCPSAGSRARSGRASRPPSSARSTRTSNQLSMLRPMNCTDTAYTSAPGSTATSANSSTSRTASREPKTPRFRFAPQLPQLPADDQHQQRDQHAVQRRAGCRSSCAKSSVFARRRGEQEQRDRRQARGRRAAASAGCAKLQEAAHGVNGIQRCQSDASVHSRDASALTWNGFGSWLTSSRRRTAAS